MKEDYLITIHGTMEQNGEEDSVELMTRGSFVRRGGSFFISYNETEATGYKGCVTTVKYKQSGIVIVDQEKDEQNRLVVTP